MPQTWRKKAAAAEGNLAELVQAEVTAKIAELGENIIVRRNIRFVLQKPGLIAAYIHHGSTLGVLLEINCTKNDTASQPAFKELAKDICLHVAASSPRFLDRQHVPAEVIATEREVFAKQVSGKPPQIIEKIVDGKMVKFYEQNCLVDQLFVKDQEKKIAAVLAEKGRELNDAIQIARYARFQVGETV